MSTRSPPVPAGEACVDFLDAKLSPILIKRCHIPIQGLGFMTQFPQIGLLGA